MKKFSMTTFIKKISLSSKRGDWYREADTDPVSDRPSDELQSVASLHLHDGADTNVKRVPLDLDVESPSPTQSTAAVNSTGQCPFKHGTVYAGPYPGYVHGIAERGICPHGCRPAMNSDISGEESLAETMLREAMEYLELYYHERSDDLSGTEGFLSKSYRMAQVKKSIYETGTYVHTFDELG
jgi:hypothetical protein